MKVRLRGVPVKATDGKAIVSEPVTYTWVVGDRRRGQPAAGSISQPSIAEPTSQLVEGASEKAASDAEPAPMPTHAPDMPSMNVPGPSKPMTTARGLPYTGI